MVVKKHKGDCGDGAYWQHSQPAFFPLLFHLSSHLFLPSISSLSTHHLFSIELIGIYTS